MSVNQREYPVIKGKDAKRFLKEEKSVDKIFSLGGNLVKTYIIHCAHCRENIILYTNNKRNASKEAKEKGWKFTMFKDIYTKEGKYISFWSCPECSKPRY
jgi:hypothetical protein